MYTRGSKGKLVSWISISAVESTSDSGVGTVFKHLIILWLLGPRKCLNNTLTLPYLKLQLNGVILSYHT